jgi:hypothetical protein
VALALGRAGGHCAVHVEKVGREHGRGLRVQELPPGRVGAPLGRWRDLQRLEDPAKRRLAGRNRVSERDRCGAVDVR